MLLHFDRSGVQRLLDHAKQAPQHLPTFRQRKPIPPALWLVGDEGVYLMSNGSPGDFAEGTTKRFVVYAKEVDPTKVDFDAWWAAKGDSFGGDDGVESIPVSDIEIALAGYPPNEPLVLDVTASAIAVVMYVPTDFMRSYAARHRNDSIREDWVNHDEGLHEWWQRSGQSMRKFLRANRQKIDEVIDNITSKRKSAHYLKYEEKQ